MSADAFGQGKNVRAEKAVIGVCLILGSIPPEINLKPNDFYREFHAKLWQAVLALNDKKEYIDIISLHKQLNRQKTNILPSYLTECVIQAIPETDPWDELQPLSVCAIQYQLAIRNAAFKRSRELLKEKVIKAIVKNEFPLALKMIQAIIEVGHD